MKNLTLARILELSIPALIVFAVSWGVFTTRIGNAEDKIIELKQSIELTNPRLQNVESNIYILCQSLQVNCIPPIK